MASNANLNYHKIFIYRETVAGNKAVEVSFSLFFSSFFFFLSLLYLNYLVIFTFEPLRNSLQTHVDNVYPYSLGFIIIFITIKHFFPQKKKVDYFNLKKTVGKITC